MDKQNYTTEHVKWQHLTSEERHEIEVRLKDQWKPYRIAKHLGRPYNTIKNEIKRGTVSLYNGNVKRYKADVGEAVYKQNRSNSKRKYRYLETAKFLRYVVKKFKVEGWSLDACFGRAKEQNLFPRKSMVCTKTLYNYVDLGMLPIKNIDLPEKLRRNTRKKKVRENKKNLGKSIDERPKDIEKRTEFGHWEIDSVLGFKDESQPVVMTLVERMTRNVLWIKAKNHTAAAIEEALAESFKAYGERYADVFKSITADNGSEFAGLSKLEILGIGVYFTHPYSSWERGTNECHNKMLRRFIPKGKSISDYSADDILLFADLINSLPRRLLKYRTPEELFEKQLDCVYAV